MFFIRKQRLFWLVSVVLTWGMLISPSIAQENKEKDSTTTVGPFSGTVVEPNGDPAPGATVWLVLRVFPLDGVQIAETTTDEKGNFTFEKVERPKVSDPEMSSLGLAVRDKKGRLGGTMALQALSRQTIVSAIPRIELKEVKDYTGRLINAENKPIVGATVQVYFVTYQSKDQGVFECCLPEKLQKDFSATTDEKGEFKVKGISSPGQIILSIQAGDEYGKPLAQINPENAGPLKLNKIGTVKGKISAPDADAKLSGITIRLNSRAESRESRSIIESNNSVLYIGTLKPSDSGEFEFKNVPAGFCQMSLTLPKGIKYLAESQKNFELMPGETATIEMSLKTGLKIQGRVVDEKTGEGVKGVYVTFYSTEGKGSSTPATTDESGAFTCIALPGKNQLQVYQYPEKYSGIDEKLVRTFDFKADTALDPIKLLVGNTLDGYVVDKEGKPVAGAKITYSSLEMGENLGYGQNIVSDKNGKFTIGKLPPKQKFVLRANTDRAASEQVIVNLGENAEPPKIVCDEKTSSRLIGVVCDDQEKPLPDADIDVWVHFSYGNWGTSTSCRKLKSDKDGKFEAAGLWPAEKYDIKIALKNHEKFGSKQIQATAGEAYDFGNITLNRCDGDVSGKVVDMSGAPVQGVRVFNVADGAVKIETASDADGKFSLKGFHKGPVFVFAQKEGFRFTGASASSGDANVVVTLYKKDQLPPQNELPDAVALQEKDKQRAIRLLEDVWPMVPDKKRSAVVKKMMVLDMKRAEEWAEDARIKIDPLWTFNLESYKKLAVEDLDEALSIVTKDPGNSASILMEMTKTLAPIDPEKTQRCIEEALVRVRSTKEPTRTLYLAQLGEYAAQAGNPEAGKKLTAEALKAMENWKPTERNEYTIGQIAASIGANDIPGALTLLDKISNKNEKNNFISQIASKINDLDAAEKMLKDVEPWYAQRAQLRLACRIAAKRPDDAIRLIETCRLQNANDEGPKATAFGCVAVTIAPQNPQKAYDLVDRAFEILLRPKGREESYYQENQSIIAAFLAYQAANIGYPDRKSLVYRALACRPNPENTEAVRLRETCVVDVVYLSFVDPEIAQKVLQPLEQYADSIGSGFSGIGQDDWKRAIQSVYPDELLGVTEWHLNSIKDKDERQKYIESDVYLLVQYWTQTPKERLKYFIMNHGNLNISESD